jgi:hypothetical protein
LTLKRIGIVLLLVGLVIGLMGTPGAGEESKPREMIHAYRVWKLTEALDLSEEEMPVFFSRLKDLDAKEAELVREEQEGVREIAALLGKEDVSEGDLRRALDRHEAARAKLLEEIHHLRGETLSMLDTRQRCKYVVFEHRFRAELRDMISRARELGRGQADDQGRGSDFGKPDPGGRGVGGGMPGGSGRGRR